ncbi:hypothetical protein [Streptomyces sp. NPDC055013]
MAPQAMASTAAWPSVESGLSTSANAAAAATMGSRAAGSTLRAAASGASVASTNWLRMWAVDGTRERVYTALMVHTDAAEDLNWVVSVDSTSVRAHQHAAGARKNGHRPGSPATMPSAGLAAG